MVTSTKNVMLSAINARAIELRTNIETYDNDRMAQMSDDADDMGGERMELEMIEEFLSAY